MVFSIVAVAYVALTAGSLLASFFDDFSDDCAGCPPNAFLIVDSPTTVSVIDAVLVIAGIPALLASLLRVPPPLAGGLGADAARSSPRLPGRGDDDRPPRGRDPH